MLPAGMIYALLKADGEMPATIEHPNSAALEIRLRRRASFQEKLRQLIGKYFNKKGRPKAPFSMFREGRIRGEF